MMMNHVDRARSRLIAQYRNKQQMRKWVSVNPSIAQTEIEEACQRIILSYDVDEVSGEMLNIIGRIVGIFRPVVRITDYQVFGYEGNPNYGNYDVAPYIGDGDPVKDQPMSDFLYRRLIKAKIAKNISDGTIDSIIALTTLVTGVEVVTIVDNQDMSFAVGFERALDPNTAFLVANFDIIPRPQGVRLDNWFVLPPNIAEIEASSEMAYQFANFTLPGDVL